jgi:hypothetical protein
MADLKISQLTGATTPLAGTEVLPIVQSSSTKKVTVSDLTTGRAINTAGGTFTDNQIQGTAAKGINFTANTPAAGMTSQLLNWYEEGTWTPTMTSATGTTTVNTSSARYTRIGDHVFVVFQIDYSTDASVGTSDLTIGGLPFTSRTTFYSRGFVTSSNWTGSDYNDGYLIIGPSVTSILWSGRAVNQSSRTNAILLFCADYFTT